MNCFMVTWHPLLNNQPFNRQLLLNALDVIPEVRNWRASTGAVFIASDSTAIRLFEQIHQKLPALTFMVAPIDIHSVHGWSDKDTWQFIERPRPVGTP